MPFQTVEVDAISWDTWWFERESVRHPLPDLLPGWDYASREKIGVTVNIDGDSVLSSTGLSDLSLMRLVLSADCLALGCRFSESTRLSGDLQQQLELSVDIPPAQAAQKLELAVHLVLDVAVESPPRVASLVGSRLGASPKRTLVLEGEASRFPTDAVDFATIGLENAPWTITASFDDLHDSFMGSIRLLVNESHPLGRAVLSPEGVGLQSERLKVDVLRMLISTVGRHESDTDEYDDDSVGAVVSSMCELYLRRSLLEATTLYRDDPLRFDRLCYQAVAE